MDGTEPKNKEELLSEWKKYFEQLLNVNNNTDSQDVPPSDSVLPIDTEKFTAVELKTAIHQMKNGKSSGIDRDITAEALKHGSKNHERCFAQNMQQSDENRQAAKAGDY